MRLAFKKLSAYIKVTLVVLVASAIAAVLFENRGNAVSVWFFGFVDDQAKTNVVWVMLWSAVAALVSWWTLKLSIGLLRDFRALSREKELRNREDAVRTLSEEVKQRERRLDEQARKALADATNDE